MEYVRDIKPKGILLYHPDTKKARKDAAYVRYSYNGMEICIVLVVTISWEQGHFVGGKWERSTGKWLSSGIESIRLWTRQYGEYYKED